MDYFFSLSQYDCRHLPWLPLLALLICLPWLPGEGESSVMSSLLSQIPHPRKGHLPQTTLISLAPFPKVKGKILTNGSELLRYAYSS
jgi:hypothetical protein